MFSVEVMSLIQEQVVQLGKCPFCRKKTLVDIESKQTTFRFQQCQLCLKLFACENDRTIELEDGITVGIQGWDPRWE